MTKEMYGLCIITLSNLISAIRQPMRLCMPCASSSVVMTKGMYLSHSPPLPAALSAPAELCQMYLLRAPLCRLQGTGRLDGNINTFCPGAGLT